MKFKIGCALILLTGTAQAQVAAVSDADSKQEVDQLFAMEQALQALQVTSASQQQEPLSETPVPVTVITAEMIRGSGARNLQEALATYVPGMSVVEDQNEINIAMRGVYGSSQQKILILLNGHRLNSRAYSSENPDFGIGLAKVKQIEVLRGPGSSLYGNVALTAVVNIITRDGAEVDGIEARVGLGNHGAQTYSLTAGKGWGPDHDLLIWAQTYSATGEIRSIPASQDLAAVPRDGSAILGGVRGGLPSYDVGVNYRINGFTVLLNSQLGQRTEPFTSAGVTGESYNYNAYRTFQGVGPGLTSQSNHAELRYAHALGEHFEVDVRGYYDTNAINGILTVNPELVSASLLSWNEQDLGIIAQGRYLYQLGFLGAGNATAGFQVDRMQLYDSVLGSQTGGQWTGFGDTNAKPVLERGSETINSGFAQLKQHLGETLILNAGVRFDDKDRHKGPNVSDWSPRLALIYTPVRWGNVKLSYSQSFVDAPYWYRYNSLPSYRGAETLTPEHLRSVQLTPTIRFLDGRLTNTLNVFYNDLYDFIFRNNAALPTQPLYQNAGTLKTLGVENEIAYLLPFLRARGNFTYQKVLESRSVPADGSQIFNVPQFWANAIVDVNPFYKFFDHSWVNVNVRYMGPQLSPLDIRFANGVSYEDPRHRVAPYVVVNAGARVEQIYFKGLGLDVTVYNLLNAQYEQGGSTVHPYPQPGRWFLATLRYKFDPLSM